MIVVLVEKTPVDMVVIPVEENLIIVHMKVVKRQELAIVLIPHILLQQIVMEH